VSLAASAGGDTGSAQNPAMHVRHPSAVLLIVQLVGLLLYPILESTRAGPVALTH
jgi:hypothetical protein